MEVQAISSAIQGLSFILQTAQTYAAFKRVGRSDDDFKAQMEADQVESIVTEHAIDLVNLIPESTLNLMSQKVNQCWKDYDNALKSIESPAREDRLTEEVKTCLCQHISLIKNLNAGNVPHGPMYNWWMAYCDVQN